jgi:hypothetical protein
LIYLKPLSEENVNEMLRDSLFCKSEEVAPLAELVFQKTGGNPFFITELLKQLTKKNQLPLITIMENGNGILKRLNLLVFLKTLWNF